MDNKIIISSKYLKLKLKEFEDHIVEIDTIDVNKNYINICVNEFWINVNIDNVNFAERKSYAMEAVNFKEVLKFLENMDDQPITLFLSENKLSIKID